MAANQTHDINGIEYARVDQLEPGMIVRLDDGFTCHKAGETIIYADDGDASALYFRCSGPGGRHYIGGQLAGDDEDHLVGIYLP